MSQPNDPWSTPFSGQTPSSGQTPTSGQQPSYGQAPAYGQQPAYGQAPAYGQQGGQASPYGYAPSGPPTRPSTVRNAVTLMYVGAVLSVISGLTTLLARDQLQAEFDAEIARQGASGDVPTGFGDTIFGVVVVLSIVFGVIGAGLWIMNAVFCGKGRNWSRITGTVLGGLYILSFLSSLVQPSTGLVMAVSVVTVLVVIATIVLLWLRPSNEFFAAARAARSTG